MTLNRSKEDQIGTNRGRADMSFEEDFREFFLIRVCNISEKSMDDDKRKSISKNTMDLSKKIMAVLDDDYKKLFIEYSDSIADGEAYSEELMYRAGMIDGAKLVGLTNPGGILDCIGYPHKPAEPIE